MFLTVSIFCILVYVCQTCNTDAPQISLKELHGGCNSASRSRSPDCYAAYNRFCNRVQYLDFSQKITAVGVSREVSGNRIGISCIKVDWAGDVSIEELKSYHSGCDLSKSQHRDCLAATHRFCNNKLGIPAGGINTEVGNGVLGVKCFIAAKKEHVNLNVMKDKHSGCNFPNSDSANCFAAASRWCTQFGYNGGITQEVNNDGMTVACYDAEYSRDAYIARNSDYFEAQTKAIKVCNINFDVDNAKILDAKPEFLKTELYDNRGSSVELNSVFDVSKSIMETSSFSHEHSLTLGTETEVNTGFPFVAGGKVTLSASITSTINFYDESSETIEYVASSPVSVPPAKAIMKEAVVTRAKLDVDWSARVVNGLGAIVNIGGKWTGVDTYDFKVIQEDVI